MYRITKIFLTDKQGRRTGVDKTVVVPDLEAYRQTLELKEGKTVNFIYETTDDDHQREIGQD